ncbi:MAG: Calx-beta domain-containing protein, partial [Verrucomicrobiota bacterium]
SLLYSTPKNRSFRPDTNYTVAENGTNVVITIFKNISVAASLNYGESNVTAFAGSDFTAVSGTLDFASGETNRTITIPIINNNRFEGNRNFTFYIANPTVGSVIQPGTATVTILEDEDATARLRMLDKRPIGSRSPPGRGRLTANIQGADGLGQWRIVGDAEWHSSRAFVEGVPAGSYEIEFSSVIGYGQPVRRTIQVRENLTNNLTAAYARARSNRGYGSLRVQIQPSDLASTNVHSSLRAQWRLVGESDSSWRNSDYILIGLFEGSYEVEFKELVNYERPPTVRMNVTANQTTTGTFHYTLRDNVSNPNVALPTAQPYLAMADGVDNNYAYNGQIHSQVGYGSGSLVKRRVVLTAGHVLYDDAQDRDAEDVKWFFQRHVGTDNSRPLKPRGWFMLDGYVPQRRTEHTPGISSPASYNLDAGVLYFLADAGRGGEGGYLASDAESNEWLISSRSKALLGYPVEVVPSADRGRFHASPPFRYQFQLLSGRVYVTIDVIGYPGNSGGGLCVKHDNGLFYPAAIYLGGSGGQSVFRAIDSRTPDIGWFGMSAFFTV